MALSGWNGGGFGLVMAMGVPPKYSGSIRTSIYMSTGSSHHFENLILVFPGFSDHPRRKGAIYSVVYMIGGGGIIESHG